jgi:hypothetical protein
VQTAPTIPAPLKDAYVKSITFGGDDVLNSGLRITGQSQSELVITIGTNPGSVEGRVLNGNGQPVAASTVVMVPESGLKFRIDHKVAFTNVSGGYQIQGVPPGDYQVYAFEQMEKGDWQNPTLMRPFDGRGKLVHVDEGGKANVELVAIPAP